MCTWHIKVKGFPLWGYRGEKQTAGLYSFFYKLVLCRIQEMWVSRQMVKELKDDQRAAHQQFSFLKRCAIFHQKMDENNNLCNVFLPFSFLHSFSFPLLSLSLSFSHCHSLSLIHSLSLCNQIGLSYTPTALWLLAAGFRCLQSGCTFQQANDCGRMKL